MKCVISGSFRRFYDGIAKTAEQFNTCGIKVLSPKISRVVDPNEEFVLLESDTTSDIKTLEQNHLDAIKHADFLYVYNPEGYIGMSAIMEMGWTLALHKPVFALERPSDLVLAQFVKIKSPQELCDGKE